MKFSKRSESVQTSGIRKVFELAATIKNPVDLSIGQPDFSLFGSGKDAAHKAIDEGFTRYTMTQGIAPLREKIAKYYLDSHGVEFEDVVVTSGVAGGVLLTFFALLNEGDEILIPDPAFMLYEQWANFLGVKTVRYNTYPTFVPTASAIAEKLTSKTKIVLLLTPSNPTGAIIDDAGLQEIAKLAKEKNLFVISDEIYDRFTYDSQPNSISKYYDNTLVLGGFSKFAGMPGMRLGYALGKADLLGELKKLQQFSFVCAPSISQKIGIAMLDADFTPTLDRYREKRDIIYNGLKDNFEVNEPKGAFYCFPKAPWGTGRQFVEHAIKNRVLVIPGAEFSDFDTHFRISFASPNEVLYEGIEILNRIALNPPAEFQK